MKELVIFGLHPVETLLTKNPSRIIRLIILKDRSDQKVQNIIESAKKHPIDIEWLPRQELDRIANKENHQGVIAICHETKIYNEDDLATIIANLIEPPFLLILDSVQDPHNLGACLRSADAAGVHAVIAPKDKAVSVTPTVRKVASGAAETVPFIQVTNLARTLRWLKDQGVWLYGAASEGDQAFYQANLLGPVAIVLGAEGSGLRRLTRDNCDVLVSIPMQGFVSSLNVSVATGVLLFEVVRQRLSQ